MEYQDNCFDIDQNILEVLDHLGILTRPVLWLTLLQFCIYILIFHLDDHSQPIDHGKDHYLHHVGVVFLSWGVAHHNGLLITPLRLVVLVVAGKKCF